MPMVLIYDADQRRQRVRHDTESTLALPHLRLDQLLVRDVPHSGEHSERWTIEGPQGKFEALFLKRTDPLPKEPSMGMERYVERIGLDSEMVALVYPDRRGDGYGLSRYRDHQNVNFSRIETEADVHFAHARGFVAKSSATEIVRLKELLKLAQTTG